LAVPPLLGLAAIGVEHLIGRESLTRRRSTLSRLLLAASLLAALYEAWNFDHRWLGVHPVEVDVDRVLGRLSAGADWVSVPLGEHFFMPPALDREMRIATDAFNTWHWRNRRDPLPRRTAWRGAPPPNLEIVDRIGDVTITADPSSPHYAVLLSVGGKSVCQATGIGGNIDVTCDSDRPGLLVVQEHWARGWTVSRGDKRRHVTPGEWLTAGMPAGRSTVRFRYRPVELWWGIAFWALGYSAAAWWIYAPDIGDGVRSSRSWLRTRCPSPE
jgi:hypothetical protein